MLDPKGRVIGEVGEGSRKDLRNAVEAARAAAGWANQTAHNRAQVVYYIAENLAARAEETAARLARMTGDAAGARAEVDATIERLFSCAAWADKYDGAVHHTPLRNVTLAMPEAVGTIGIVCPDEAPLLAFVTLVASAIAMGNTVIAVPSERHPLAATDFYPVLETSDVPAGVVNIVTGARDELAKVLAEHADVDAVWYFGSAEGSALVERASVSNLKQTWVGVRPAVRLRPRRRPRAAAPRDPGQEHLGPLRGLRSRLTAREGVVTLPDHDDAWRRPDRSPSSA